MVNIPVRNLSERGIIADLPPWELPPNAFSNGANVRFKDGRVGRAPVFRTLADTVLVGDPMTVAGYRPSTGYDLIMVGDTMGSIRDLQGADRTPVGRVGAFDARPWTNTLLGDVLYMNRPSHLPAALLPQATAFVDLPNWPSTWRTASLRAARDFLFAFNITKGANKFPTTVAWSDATLFGQVPGSWDATNLSTLANELPLPRLDSPIVDGLPLGDSLIVYSENQVIRFEYTGDTADAGQNLWINRPLFATSGMISTNCAVEVAGRHYVFGTDDIYVHDGVAKQSVSDRRVRRWVYGNMNRKLADRNFVFFIPKTNEVLFAFVSGDPDAYFQNPTRCNKGAVLNIDDGTWTFVELPNVSAGTLANVDPTLLWNTAGTTRTWENTGGSWYDLRDGSVRHAVFAASAIPTSALPTPSIFAYDEMNLGQLAYPMKPEANPPAFVERIGIDLDELGVALPDYKVVTRIFPQMTTYRDVPVRFRFGSAQTSQGPYEWEAWRVYNPRTQYKVDTRRGGRYLAFRMEVINQTDFDFSGFDAEIVGGGKR